jgi:hypothetical protein
MALRGVDSKTRCDAHAADSKYYCPCSAVLLCPTLCNTMRERTREHDINVGSIGVDAVALHDDGSGGNAGSDHSKCNLRNWRHRITYAEERYTFGCKSWLRKRRCAVLHNRRYCDWDSRLFVLCAGSLVCSVVHADNSLCSSCLTVTVAAGSAAHNLNAPPSMSMARRLQFCHASASCLCGQDTAYTHVVYICTCRIA